MRETQNIGELFEDTIELPNPRAAERLAGLVGLDKDLARLVKEARLLLRREELTEWSQRVHGRVLPAVDELMMRSPLIIFSGDVGCGKTTLAETFADPLARELRVTIRVMRLSLRARGSGAVGELSKLVGVAFEQVCEVARGTNGKAAPVVFVIDEADALGQSRELAQMHHEDRAGVNAVIRGIDQIAERGLQVLVVMCTNRLDALDAAIRRRAGAEAKFRRPDLQQRLKILRRALDGSGIADDVLLEVAKATGETPSRTHGYTHSDLRQRLIPSVLLAAFPDRPLTGERLLEHAHSMEPTPPLASEERARA